MRILVGRLVGDRIRIEHSYIAPVADLEAAAFRDADLLGVHAGHFLDRIFQGDDLEVANVAAQARSTFAISSIARGGGGPDIQPNSTIVGVVADMRYRGLSDNSEQVFFPLFENDDTGATFYIRVRGAPDQAISSIRHLIRQNDPRLPILWFRTLDDQVNRSLSTERLLAALSSSFGALALLLSLIGLYGVMSFVVTRRTREIGIRLALGATGSSAIRLVLRDAVAMIAVGMAIALPFVAALSKLVQSQLFGVTATDPATIAAAALVLAAGALSAAFIPAWRASKVSPTDALRLE